jgi:PAS domain S-box-containing protein
MRRLLPAFADLPLRQKGLVLVAIPVLALLIVLAALVAVQHDEQEAERWVRHTFEVRQNLQLDLTLLVDAETGTRGYLLTGKQEWLEPYRNATGKLPGSLEALRALIRDNPVQELNVRVLKEMVDDRLRNLSNLQAHAAPLHPGEMEAELQRSKASMDRARLLFRQMQEHEELLLVGRTAHMRRVRPWLYVLIGVAMLAGLGGGLVSAWLYGAWIAGRLERLTESAARLAHRQTLLAVDAGRDEIGRLSGVLETTDRMLAERERELRETQSFLEHLVETSPTVIFRQDPRNLQVTYVSPNAERLLGYTTAEILAAPDFWMERVHPDDRPRVLEYDRRAFASCTGRIELEYRFRHKDGTYRWLDSFGYIGYDAAGKPVELLGHRLDITDRKHVEDVLRERQANLDAANKELESFSYSVSHDLRSPLRSIDGFSMALMEDYGAQLDPQAMSYLQRVRAATQRMGELIDDMLNLSRVARSPLRRVPVNLSGLAESILHDLRQGQPERPAEFVVAPGLEDHCDATLIRAALENLLGNAWKFTSKHPAARIEFGRTDGAYFVRDDGAGFDATYKTKLFGAFQRLHHASDFPGTGIGLATVQRIMRRHGGQAWAEGAPEQGATFYFTLHPNKTA